MDFVTGLFVRSFEQVVRSLLHNWPFLLVSIAIATVLKLLVDGRKVSAFFARHRRAGVGVATAVAIGTPLCSCGTTAVVLGMMASTLPWGPIVAFMVASPLSSPEGMVYTAGLFGWPFAIAMTAASAALGLAGGAAASALERRGLLAGQARFAAAPAAGLAVRAPKTAGAAGGSCGCSSTAAPRREAAVGWTARLRGFPRELLRTGGRLLAMFLGFAFVGYVLNGLIPSSWISTLFGPGKAYGVPLAATVGLPLYLSSEASLPLVRALLESGMSPGSVMAFLIAGSGTSIGAVAGALTIARWRVVALVVGVLWAGAIAAGYGFNVLVALGLAA